MNHDRARETRRWSKRTENSGFQDPILRLGAGELTTARKHPEEKAVPSGIMKGPFFRCQLKRRLDSRVSYLFHEVAKAAFKALGVE